MQNAPIAQSDLVSSKGLLALSENSRAERIARLVRLNEKCTIHAWVGHPR